MADVECPLGDCGYTGPVRSVEAHISSNTDDDHQGEVGRLHREDLVAQAEGDETGAETTDSDEGSSASPEVVADGGSEEPVDTGDETSEVASEDASEDEGSEGAGSGLPFPALSTTQIVVLLVAVFLLASFLTSTSTGEEVVDEVDSEDEDEDVEEQEVTLIE